LGRAPFGDVDSLYCLALTDRGTTAKISSKVNYGAVAREILISEFGNGKSESGKGRKGLLGGVGVGLTAGGGGLEWSDENGSRGE
jgi:hypothetical protein